MPRILIVDDDQEFRTSLVRGLAAHYNTAAAEARTALTAMNTDSRGCTDITAADLPAGVGVAAPPWSEESILHSAGIDLKRRPAEVELRYVESALNQAGGRKNVAARLLGYNDRFALLRRVKAILERYPQLARGLHSVKEGYVE